MKGKQSRFFPVVIKLGVTPPIKDDGIAVAVDLADEGIEIQLKLFPAWRSYASDICFAMVLRKANLPYLQCMASQSLVAATERLDEVEDAYYRSVQC